MNATDLLANVRIASPCSGRWAEMTGDQRARFCGQCQKHVYNLSDMTAEAAANLIREKEGSLCVRFYRRSDGTMLTADCPVGAAAVMRRVKRLVVVGIGILVPAFAAPAWVGPPSPPSQPRNKLYQTWDKTLVAIKNWIKPPPPIPPLAPPVFGGRFTMGDVCLPSSNLTNSPPSPKLYSLPNSLPLR